MTRAPSSLPALLANRRHWLALLLLWSAVVLWSLWGSIADIRRHNQDVVTEGARNMFRMVVLTRLWNSQHGGVYVPVTDKAQPNPYLKHSKRDIKDNFGRDLTLVNPAFMTRLIAEVAKQDHGVQFHITSLKLLNPSNAPDPWETRALEAFELGKKEVVGFEEQAELGMVHRYMAPLPVVEPCLQCHAEQGYKVGDVRGGISVTQRYAPFLQAAWPSELQTYLSHAAVFLLVSGLCWTLLEQLRLRWIDLLGKIEEVEATRQELLMSEKMASLGRMVAGFAHEINTPIGVAVGAISNSEETLSHIDTLLTCEEVSEDQLRDALSTLRQGDNLALANLQRAARLVQGFKRTSIDQTSEEKRLFNVGEMVSDVLHNLHNQLKRQPITVHVDCPETLAVHGHPGLLEQLLTNLVMNSLLHGFTQDRPQGEIRITWRVDRERVQLIYADSGIGMTAAVRDKIFEPFFTTQRGQGGSGLGMYICYNIVTSQLGGTIQCQSAPGEGVQFTIEFPAEIHSHPREAKG